MTDLLIVGGKLRVISREVAGDISGEDRHVAALLAKLVRKLDELAVFAEDIEAKRYERTLRDAASRGAIGGTRTTIGLLLLVAALACGREPKPVTLTTRDSLGNTFKLTVLGADCVVGERIGAEFREIVCEDVRMKDGGTGTVTIRPER